VSSGIHSGQTSGASDDRSGFSIRDARRLGGVAGGLARPKGFDESVISFERDLEEILILRSRLPQGDRLAALSAVITLTHDRPDLVQNDVSRVDGPFSRAESQCGIGRRHGHRHDNRQKVGLSPVGKNRLLDGPNELALCFSRLQPFHQKLDRLVAE
jgi:hypothetical protein